LVTAGSAAGTTLPLEDELLVGSSASGPGLLGNDPAISPRHARIARLPSGAILVVDLGSREGTWVNGTQVSTGELRDGDLVRFGATTLELSDAGVPVAGKADARAFRSQFPIFEQAVYLNAGMEGPVPARAIAAVEGQLEVELQFGRSGMEHWGNLQVLCSRLRDRYAHVLGCDSDEVALTRATTDGVNVVLGGLRFERGAEILTTDEEHQGVYAPLAAVRERQGCRIRIAPFDELATAVTPETRLIVCSHVSWLTGRVIDATALKDTGVPFLLDGAQALGAIPVDVRELGCDFYAASGQKWLCGPDRSGCLYVRSDRIEDLSPPPTSNFFALADPQRPLDLVLHPGARRFDPGNLPGSTALWALAALDVLEEAGLDWVTDRGPMLAEQLAERFREATLPVEPRGHSTILSFPSDDAARVADAFAAEHITVRDVPGRVRVSVGAWCLDEDIDRVVDIAARTRANPGGRSAVPPRTPPHLERHSTSRRVGRNHPTPTTKESTMIQFTTEGVELTATDDELRTARETFERDKLLRLPGLISPELAQVIQEGIERDGFEDPDEATHKSAYAGLYVNVRHDLRQGPTVDMMNERANDPTFLDFVRQVAQLPHVERCVGRVVRLLPASEDFPWHTDADAGRVGDLVVDISADRYDGCSFEMRDAETKEIFTTVADMQYREGTLALISPEIEHHNLRVTSTNPRITFVGWFVSPDGPE